jgi:hypothetical protein
MRIVTLAGPGRNRGVEYGEALHTEVAAAANALKTHLARTGHSPGQLSSRLLASPLTRAAEQFAPDLWAEVTALARSSGVPLEDVLMLTFLDEVWALSRQSIGCSVAARAIDARPGEPPTPATTEIGQTMDLPAWTVERVVVLRIGSPDVPNALVLAYPGSIGLCGSNESGLGVAVNALSHLPFDEAGMGVAFVTRHLLTLTTLADAEAFLTSVPHAVGQAYTIAARDGIATFEAGPGTVRRVSDPSSPAVVHTNHTTAPDADAMTPSASSQGRLDALVRSLEMHRPLADTLTDDVVLDGETWGDPLLTFAAFRAVGAEPVARFIDGAAVRAGHREWSRFTYH